MKARLLVIHALSPLHAGTGQGVGIIDQPIAREKATNIPYLPGSSLKGVLRGACTSDNKTAVFGPDTKDTIEHAGSAQFTDQRLLLLPIRSLAGTFAWVTSPYLLKRFRRDVIDMGFNSVPTIPEPASNEAICGKASVLLIAVSNEKKIVLEDLDLNISNSNNDEWADWLAPRIFADDEWRDMLKQRLCIVPDNVFTFLLETATQITARIRLEEQSKTVVNGGLWYEESLPTETVLTGMVVATTVKVKKNGDKDAKVLIEPDDTFDVIKSLTGTLQLGGSATVGRGLCRVHMPEGGK